MQYRVFFLLPFLWFWACNGSEQASDANDAPSAGNGPTFTLQPPSTTGLDVMNSVDLDFEFNYDSFAYLLNGAGIGVLDYDLDGLQDLFFVSNQHAHRLFHNEGDWKFTDVSTAAGIGATGGFCTGVSVADVNADGYPDLYISRTGTDAKAADGSRRNLLFLNQKDGTFIEAARQFGLDSDHPSTQATFFDYDGDGDLDCYLLNTPTDFKLVNRVRVSQAANGAISRVLGPIKPYESDQLFRNDGGKFTDVSAAAGIVNRGFGLSVAIYDFNDDQLPDIYVANDYVDPDHLFINQGNGTFVDENFRYFRHTTLSSMGSDIADLNNDGLADLVTLDMLAEDLVRQKRLENGMRPDRYNSLVRFGYGHQFMRNQMQINTGTGFVDYAELAGIAATDWSWAPLLADFDNDRHVDLFVSNGYHYDVGDLDFIEFTSDSIRAKGGATRQQFSTYADYLKLIPSNKVSNYLYRNNGDLRFTNVTAASNLAQPSFSTSSVYADLDNDGDLDLIVGNHGEPPFVYRNETVESGQSGSWLQVTAAGGQANPLGYGLAVSAFVGEEEIFRQLYPVRGFLGTTQGPLHFGLGNAKRIDRLEVRWPDGKTQVLENVAVNQILRLSHQEASRKSIPSAPAPAPLFTYPADQRGLNFVHVENPFDDFDRQSLQPRMLSREGPALAVGDANGDGLQDVLIGGASGQSASLYLQTSAGAFSAATYPFPPDHQRFEDVAALFFDADGDGDQDLYVASGGNEAAPDDPVYQDRFYRNEGGKFAYAPAALPTLRSSTAQVVPIDFDQDGDLDLLVGGRTLPGNYPLAPRSYLLRNDGGSFTDQTQAIFPALESIGMVTAIAQGQILGDEQAEVVIAGEWMPIQVFSFRDGVFTLSSSIPNSTGFWHALLLADLNGDGSNEIVAGNEGLNTRFKPSPTRPVMLYAADFDGNGTIDPILTVPGPAGNQLPVTTKAQMLKQMPGLKKRFLRTSTYASADINDLFGAEEIAQAKQLSVDHLSSTIYKFADGQWQATPLPNSAQTSPVRAIRQGDFNQDGLPDLLMVGNDYGVHVETGRADAGNGVLLLNAGDGKWTTLPNREHGFWASLDARNLQSIPLSDGRTGWVVVNNAGPAALFLWSPPN
ncbi:VCBS repeat-containing protein [Neolewinella lacunae]|uniref:VCBS repeat-containing protein n=1 Tax=Neolewinella lacunae TaxID=1517758 RepID=A0A923PR92_9BACT|nr:VCBS repeat-containing protein [Neolewinella lacunae]MBC6996003.1 VCBS repeat-containing protein [Neolewinella lacunae]MDN3633177.1 VCBS repeat-containing protein [Neolewinella lacunae]